MSTILERARLNNQEIPSGENKLIGIVVSEWNAPITNKLLEGAVQTLLAAGVEEEDIIVEYVPGSVELTYGAKLILENTFVDAVITLGCVIKGETAHFDYVCDSVTQGVTALNLEYDVPVIFGVLTTNNLEQAEARAGADDKFGNKGEESAITALKMIQLQDKYFELDLLNDDDLEDFGEFGQDDYDIDFDEEEE